MCFGTINADLMSHARLHHQQHMLLQMSPPSPVAQAQAHDPSLAALRTAQRVALTKGMMMRRALGLWGLAEQPALLHAPGHVQAALLARCVLIVITR